MSKNQKLLIQNIFLIILVILTYQTPVFSEQKLAQISSSKEIEKFAGKKVKVIGILDCESFGKIPGRIKFDDGTYINFVEEIPNCYKYLNQKVELIAEVYKCRDLDSCVGINLRSVDSINLIADTSSGGQASKYFNGRYRDYKVDFNADGQADELRVDIGLNVPEDGKYEIFGFLQALSDYQSKKPDLPYQFDRQTLTLKRGENFITFNFDGYKFFKNKMNGPYVLFDFSLGRCLEPESCPDSQEIDSLKEAFTTRPYQYTEFEQPDLSFKGAKARFDLRTNQTVRLIEDRISDLKLKLIFIDEDYVTYTISGEVEQVEKLKINEDFSVIAGGLEQTAIFRLLSIDTKNQKATFEVEYGSSPPAPPISKDMPIDIIYLN